MRVWVGSAELLKFLVKAEEEMNAFSRASLPQSPQEDRPGWISPFTDVSLKYNYDLGEIMGLNPEVMSQMTKDKVNKFIERIPKI